MAEAKQPSPAKPAFNANPFYERLRALSKSDPQAFAGLSPASKLALFEYEGQKRLHADLWAEEPVAVQP
jgi:hypothetical protein